MKNKKNIILNSTARLRDYKCSAMHRSLNFLYFLYLISYNGNNTVTKTGKAGFTNELQ